MASSFEPAHSLAGHPYLAGVPDVLLARMLLQARWIQVGPGEMVLDFDDHSTDVFFVMQGRIRLQNRRLLEHTVLPTRLRLAAELLRLSRPRADGTRVVSPPPTHDELASRVGARRETVTRELAALSRAGQILRSRAAVVLLVPEQLRQMAAGGIAPPG